MGQIRHERDELVSAVAHIRSDMHSDVAHLRLRVKREVPKAAVAVVLALAAVAVLQIARGHRRDKPSSNVKLLRVGRFTLVEHR